MKEISLDEAIAIAGFGKHNILVFILCIVVMIGMIFESLGLSYIIPAAQCDLQLTLIQKGWLGAIPFIGVIASSHFWGWLADTKGRKPVIMYSMGIGSVFSIISSFCPDLLSFTIMRFLASIFVTAPSPVVVPYLGEFNCPKVRDRFIIFTCAFITFGTFLLPGIAWAIYPWDFRIPIESLGIVYRPWRLLIVVLALPYFICTFVMMKAPESPKFLSSQGRTDEAFEVVKSMYFMNNGGKVNPYEGLALEREPTRIMSGNIFKSMWEQTFPLFKKPLLFYTIIACTVQFNTFSNVNGFYLWLPEMVNRIMSQPDAQGTVCEVLSSMNTTSTIHETAINITSECVDTIYNETFVTSMILGAIYCPFPLVTAFIVQKIGKRTLLSIVPLVCGLSAYAIYWVTNQNVSLFLLGVIQMDSVCIGTMNAVVVELFPTNLRAMAVSLSLLVGRLGSILGSNLIGYLMEVFCPLNFFLFGSLLLVNCILCLLLPKAGGPILSTIKGS